MTVRTCSFSKPAALKVLSNELAFNAQRFGRIMDSDLENVIVLVLCVSIMELLNNYSIGAGIIFCVGMTSVPEYSSGILF